MTKINKTQVKREYNDSLARPKLIEAGFVVKKEMINEQNNLYSVIYKIDFFEIEHVLKTNRFLLKDLTKRKSGTITKYKSLNGVIDGYICKKANNSQIIKQEKRWNKESKLRLQAQAKQLKDLIQDGLSLSKACKVAKLDYQMGKLLTQENYLEKL